jgi:hypothetical protein
VENYTLVVVPKMPGFHTFSPVFEGLRNRAVLGEQLVISTSSEIQKNGRFFGLKQSIRTCRWCVL